MAPDQGPMGSSTAFSHLNAVVTYGGVRVAVVAIAIECIKDDQEEQLYEPFIPTRWKLECKRYDRINAHRSYLQQVDKEKRHFGFKKQTKKPNRRRHKR